MADRAELVFDIDSSAALGAAKNLNLLERGAAKAATASAELNTTWRNSKGQFESAATYARRNAQEIESLARKYNTTLAVQLAFSRAQEEVARAVALGVIPLEQQDAVLERLATQYTASANSANVYAGSMSRVSNVQSSVGNQFAQLNDVVVTAWGGMNPALIGMQQGMQMVQGFAGQSVPQALATLRGAFAQLFNPLTLFTVGAVAAGAAVIQLGTGLLSSGSDAKTFGDAMSRAEDAIAKINKTTSAYSKSGLEELYSKYGKITAEVRSLVEQEKLLAQLEGTKALNELLGSITGTLGEGLFNTAYGELERVFNASANEAQVLYGVIQNIGSEKSIERQLQTITTLKNRIAEATGNFTNMSSEQQNMLRSLTQAESMVRQLLAASDGLPGKFAAAAAAAGKITDELNRAVSAAFRLANSALSDVRFAQIELDFRTDKIGKAAAIAAAKFDEEVGNTGMDQWLYNSLREQAINGAKETARIMSEVESRNEADRQAERDSESGGGRADAQLKAAERGFTSLRSLLEKQSMFEIAEYEKRQDQLQMALDKRLVTEAEYNTLREQLRQYYFGSEYEQQQLQYEIEQEALREALEKKYITEMEYAERIAQIQRNQQEQTLGHYSTFFGNMASAAKAGGEKTTGAVKAFSIAQGLLNSYLAYTQVLADPSLIGKPFLRTALAASTLASGLAQVANMKSGGGGASSSAGATAPVKAEPTKNILLRFDGPDWMVGLVEGIATQLYEQSENGRVIVSREYN